MKFSIITPSYNQGAFLERTLRSVLDQGWPDLEYIVIDGGSNDESVGILERYQDQLAYWVSEPDRGQAHAVNKGLERATGDIIGWLNSDDLYRPGSLQAVADFFDAHPECLVVYGEAEYIDVDDQVTGRYPTEAWNWKNLTRRCFICQPSVFFRRSVLERFGLLDESLQFCMDYEYWLRCGMRVSFARMGRALSASRLYPENKTIGARTAVLQEIVRMLKQKLGYVPRRWLAEYALETVRPQPPTELPERQRLRRSCRAFGMWHQLHWGFNRGVVPLYPLQLFTGLPVVPKLLKQKWRQSKRQVFHLASKARSHAKKG